MRNNKLKTVREKWSHSKFFIGKNRVLSKALGGSPEEEYAEGLSMVARCVDHLNLLVSNSNLLMLLKLNWKPLFDHLHLSVLNIKL